MNISVNGHVYRVESEAELYLLLANLKHGETERAA